MAACGTRKSYQEGCHCALCREAHRVFCARQRQRRKLPVAALMPVDYPAAVDAPHSAGFRVTTKKSTRDGRPVADATPGRVEAGVLAEIELLGKHGRPGLAEGAISMARILDNPLAVSTQPAAAMDALRKGRPVSRGRLRAVQQLSRRGSPDAG
jgi:hypothetical protein